MKFLFKIALRNKHHRLLVLLTVVSMVFLTFASQLEIFAIGVITKKGPDFFELFGPEIENRDRRTSSITYEQLLQRWHQLDPGGKGVVTTWDTTEYLKTRTTKDFIQRVMSRISPIFPISGNVKNLAIMILGIAILKAVSLFFHRYITKVIAIRVSRDLRQRYFEHIQKLPMEFFGRYNIGTLSSRAVSDAAMIAESINACLVNYLQTPFTVLTTLTICFMTSWQLSLMIFLGLPMIVYPIVFLAKKVKKISKEIQKNQESFTSVLIDFLTGIQTVKIFAMEEFSLKKYEEQNCKMASLEEKSAKYDLSSRPIVHTIAMIFLGGAMLYGLYVVQMSVSEVFFYCGLLYLFYEPIKKFAEENSHIQRGIAAAERMGEVMNIAPCITDHDGALQLQKIDGIIEFEDVWFKYDHDWILKGLSFTVEPGQTVAIVGPTGAGKSTIVSLLPRLYEVQKGEIRINSIPIQKYTQKSLRESISFVPQRPFLFLDTVKENISFGKAFSEEHIIASARMAHAEEFIVKLPKGYETILSEAGKNLSGGQQQRLVIARALAKEASLLVMDEATSSLDSLSEQKIKHTIQRLKGKMTQIIIAHRLSTIENADKIIYIENGTKVAEGNLKGMLNSCIPFKAMWDAMMHQEVLPHEENMQPSNEPFTVVQGEDALL